MANEDASRVLEMGNSYVFNLDFSDLMVDIGEEIKVDVEDDNTLVISYQNLLQNSPLNWQSKKFDLPKNVDTDDISAVFMHRLLLVSVKKLNRPKQTKIIKVTMA
ncbi:17.6 kDa class II heat shock protein-like [Papaver somniferum]|uniref:17.6 kDa class II heat shock protein-like n=1 Tax=Papaver somniferum TaxID=3469 RepID=UPI000E6F4EFF|nr:17.6 kDa class II heat shock protein-like [Papaver somniferum]